MLLKGIKKEGRIRIYVMTMVLFVLGTSVFDLPKIWMQVVGFTIVAGTYLYATSYVAKKFAYKKAQHKCKEVKT